MLGSWSLDGKPEGAPTPARGPCVGTERLSRVQPSLAAATQLPADLLLPQGPGQPGALGSPGQGPAAGRLACPGGLEGPLALVHELALASGGAADRGPQNLEEGRPSGRLPVDVVS